MIFVITIALMILFHWVYPLQRVQEISVAPFFLLAMIVYAVGLLIFGKDK